MGHGEFALTALQLIPAGDAAQEDVRHLLLAEFQALAIGLVEGHRNGAADGGELHHTTLHLRRLGGLDRLISGTEIDGAGYELAHAGAGTHRLVVHLNTLAGQIGEGALVKGGGEGGTSTVEGVLSRGGGAGAEGGQGAKDQGLLSEGHGLARIGSDLN